MKDVGGIGQTTDTLDKLDDISVSEKEVRIPLPQISQISGTLILQSIVSIFMSMICVLLCAFGYSRVKTDSQYPPQDGEEHSQNALSQGTWRWGLFDCFKADIKICLVSCLC